MRPVRVLGVYLLFVFVGGALLAPGLYHLAQSGARLFPFLEPLASKPFPRFVNRALLLLALAGLVPFLRGVGLGHWRALGLGGRPHAMRQVGIGFLWGLLSLACIVGLVLTCGAREWSRDHSAGAIAGQVAKAALTAALVAPMEEVVFRGALFGALRKSLHWTLALAVSSLGFALVHFLERGAPVSTVTWESGLVVLSQMISGFASWGKMFPAFLNLTLVGLILGLAYQRFNSLYFSIGLHAGWIFWLKSYGFFTDSTASSAVWFFGTNKLINGWLAFLLLIAVLALLNRFTTRAPTHYAAWRDRQILS